jgi:hypothetical protein
MRCPVALLAIVVFALAVPPAKAISLFSRRPKVDPAQRVPELINTIRTSHEERKRIAAVEELRQYDAAAFPQIVPLLTDLLKNDPSVSVRAEAAHSLGRLRPATPAAAEALDAATHDPALRVRWQARSALLFYPAPSPPPSVAAKTDSQKPPAPVVVDSPTTVPANPVLLPVPNQSSPISPAAAPLQTPAPNIARPLPRGPETAPPPASGPELAPP